MSSFADTSQVAGSTVNPEYLYLVNGQDDNNNGWIDEGFDGIDNNRNGIVDDVGLIPVPPATGPGEWEQETWVGATTFGAETNVVYTIQRRPAPTTNAREVLLPTNVVIDLTTWDYPTPTQANPNATPSQERSRLPVNQYTGYVDIVVYPNGSVVPTTIYSTPSSFGLSASFFHFWLAERSDVMAPIPNSVNAKAPPYLPLPQGIAPTLFNGAELKGEYRLVTLFTRTGQLTTNEDVPFDNPANISGGTFNTSVPFLQAQQGVRGGN